MESGEIRVMGGEDPHVEFKGKDKELNEERHVLRTAI